ncbi:MAG: M48 family metallopeptidase, partial [Prochlorotrichaceae cyanobacterium]
MAVKPLGSLKLHPYTHLGLLILTIGLSDRFFKILPLPALPTLFVRSIVLVCGVGIYWGMIQNRHPLQKKCGSLNLRVLEIWTIGAWWVFWVQLGQAGLWLCDRLGLPWTSWPAPVTGGLLGFAWISFVSFPWILNGLLQWRGQVQPLSLTTLETASPEAAQLLRSFTTSRRLPLPTLGVIPSAVPLCWGYGWLQRPYILISQGVLDHLSGEEIAGLYGLELGYLQERSSWVLPWLVSLSQIPYLLYWFLATWGDRLVSSTPHAAKTPVQHLQIWGCQGLSYGLGVASTACYGLFKILRFLLLPLARQRCYYGDRLAAAQTGNPNAYSRALLHFANLQTRDLEARGFTHPWLESLELLLPVGYSSAHTLSQSQRHLDLGESLAWDAQSPYRYWLSLNCPHPPTGDRLYQLQHYAQRWNLTPELELPDSPYAPLPLLPVLPSLKETWSLEQGRFLWDLSCQALPYAGLLLGVGIGLSFWFIGAFVNLWGLRSLSWMFGSTALIKSCLPLGIALGILLRHNLFFPNLPRRL